MKKYAILSLMAAGGAVLPANAQIQKKPNLIWIMAEDMGHDLECYGMKGVHTPNLNRLASEGVQYNAACCTNPISSPSRSAMMTGVQQDVINAHNHRSNRDLPLDTIYKPITYYLRQAGYTCILGNSHVMGKGRKIDCNFKTEPLGKWDGVNNFGLFDKYDEFTPQDAPFFAQIQLVVTHRGDWWNKVTAESKHPVSPDVVQLPPYLPDHPQVRKEWASYLDQVEYMDNEVGMLIDELKKKGLLDNTIIFFIGDNGRCEVKGKGYLYEPGLKIPMIVWGKGIKPNTVNGIVSTLDISATLLDLAGVKIPNVMMGKPLFDKATGRSYSTCDSFYGARDTWDEVSECMRSITTDRYKYIRNYMPEKGWDCHQEYLDFHRPAIHVLRQLKAEGKLDKNQLLFMADSKPEEELYDIKNDPFELNNLAYNPKYKKVLVNMRGKMMKWQDQHLDLGLMDRNNRHPEKSTGLRDYLKTHHPDTWKSLVEGNVGQDYSRFMKEMRDSKKNN